MKLLIIAVVIGYLAINGVASWKCVKSNWFSTTQIKIHLLIIWLLPFIGGIGMLIFYTAFAQEIKPEYKSFGGGPSKHPFDFERRY